MTKPQRYGTSGAPREDGIFCLYSEYEKVVAECERLRDDAERYRWLKDNVGKWECNYTSVGFTRGLVGEVFYPKCTFSASGTRYSGFMFEDAIDAARGAK